MFSRSMKQIGRTTKRICNHIFTTIYSFDSPVCFLNENDYDLSGYSRKIEPEIEDEFQSEAEKPLDQYDMLTSKLMEIVLGQYYEKLVNVERTEATHQAEILKNYPGWNNDVFFVLHYEFYITTGQGKNRLINFHILRQILSILGVFPDSKNLKASYNKFKRPDGNIDFTDYLNILYYCDEPEANGSLGYTAEAIRIQGLNYKTASSLDMASLIEFGLM